MTEKQIQELLSDMSLEEKIGQMLQLTGNFFSDDGFATGPMEDMNLTEEQVKNTGSILSTVGAARLKGLQTQYMKTQPHKIPMLFMADVINGYRTVFPIPLAQGCSFNPEMSKKMSEIAAKEASRAGVHVVFSPMVDLVRDARWGRVMESTGEDVYLNQCFAKAMVEGYQGNSIGDKDKVSACIKHFAGYGAPMGGREYNQVEVSERSFQEDYLPSYKAGVDAGARMVMTSFNTIGRVPMTGNKAVMRDVLRKQWGFDGILISDWAAIRELIYHSIAEDENDAAFLGLQAGVDIDMVTNVYSNHLKGLVESGKVPMEWIDESVLRILNFKNEMGLFENPYKDADEAYDEMSQMDAEHVAYARKSAPETFVLLKNDGILPLGTNENNREVSSTGKAPTNGLDERKVKYAFIGPFITEERVCGSWSLFYNVEENVTIEKALTDRVAEGKLAISDYVVSKGCTTLAPGQHLLGFTGPQDNAKTTADVEAMMTEAVEAASRADTVILAIGEHYQMTGEGAARTEITIPEHQLELFRRVYAVNKNIVVVNFSGRPLDLREVSSKAKAIMQVWYPGTETGHAIVDVLFGDASPSGRLSMSFPFNVGQVPVYYSELHTGRVSNDPENRFCSRYIDAPNKPLYVFGHGLDYTQYSYSNLKLSEVAISDETPIVVSVDVKNVGNRDGVEVVQMYIQDLTGSVARPVRQLKGFKKLAIKAGETKTVSFEIDLEMLKFYDINMNYVAEPGKYKVFVGHDSDAELMAEFCL